MLQLFMNTNTVERYPKAIEHDSRATVYDLAVLAVMWSTAHTQQITKGKSGEDNSQHIAKIGYAQLKARTHIGSDTTIKKAVYHLKEMGYIKHIEKSAHSNSFTKDSYEYYLAQPQSIMFPMSEGSAWTRAINNEINKEIVEKTGKGINEVEGNIYLTYIIERGKKAEYGIIWEETILKDLNGNTIFDGTKKNIPAQIDTTPTKNDNTVPTKNNTPAKKAGKKFKPAKKNNDITTPTTSTYTPQTSFEFDLPYGGFLVLHNQQAYQALFRYVYEGKVFKGFGAEREEFDRARADYDSYMEKHKKEC